MTGANAMQPPAAPPARSIIGGSLGNFVEWYDWYVYSAFSVYFASRLLPLRRPDGGASEHRAGLRRRLPRCGRIGAWLMGVYADRHGRKSGLALSVGLMGGGSLMIAFIPTAQTIGIARPSSC